MSDQEQEPEVIEMPPLVYYNVVAGRPFLLFQVVAVKDAEITDSDIERAGALGKLVAMGLKRQVAIEGCPGHSWVEFETGDTPLGVAVNDAICEICHALRSVATGEAN